MPYRFIRYYQYVSSISHIECTGAYERLLIGSVYYANFCLYCLGNTMVVTIQSPVSMCVFDLLLTCVCLFSCWHVCVCSPVDMCVFDLLLVCVYLISC